MENTNQEVKNLIKRLQAISFKRPLTKEEIESLPKESRLRKREEMIRETRKKLHPESEKFTAKKETINRKKKPDNPNTGFDPELFAFGAEMAAFHLEAGARKFTDFASRMIADVGDAVRPYLKAFYNGARHMPGLEKEAKEMDSHETVAKTDVQKIKPYDSTNEDEPPYFEHKNNDNGTKKNPLDLTKEEINLILTKNPELAWVRAEWLRENHPYTLLELRTIEELQRAIAENVKLALLTQQRAEKNGYHPDQAHELMLNVLAPADTIPPANAKKISLRKMNEIMAKILRQKTPEITE